MAVYVDSIRTYPKEAIQPKARRYGNEWCHMSADSEAELLEAAIAIGIPVKHVQDHNVKFKPHFDLTPARRLRAVANGAIELSVKEYMAKVITDYAG